MYFLLAVVAGILLGITIRYWKILPVWARVLNIAILTYDTVLLLRFIINIL